MCHDSSDPGRQRAVNQPRFLVLKIKNLEPMCTSRALRGGNRKLTDTLLSEWQLHD